MVSNLEGSDTNRHAVESALAHIGDGLLVDDGHDTATGALNDLGQEGCPLESGGNADRVVVDYLRPVNTLKSLRVNGLGLGSELMVVRVHHVGSSKRPAAVEHSVFTQIEGVREQVVRH